MNHITGVLNLQARSRRNALDVARLVRARRNQQYKVDRALLVAGAASPAAQRH